MNKKTIKILAFALTFALVLCLGFAFMASAEETKPEIISKNMKYGEKFAIMYAVDAATVAEGPVTLRIYAEEPTETSTAIATYTAKAPQTEEINGVDTLVYVFVTNGVSPKDICDRFYAQATDADDNVSDAVSYSVVEYFLERLYGGYELSDKQTTMYTKALEFGAAAQDLLAEGDAIRVNDYKYVRVENGTVNGVTRGMFLKDTALTVEKNVAANALFWNWKVTENGETRTEATLDNFTLENSMVIEANIIEAGTRGYFGKFGGYTYDGFTAAGPVYNNFVKNDLIDRIGVDTLDATYESHPKANHLSLVAVSDTDKVLEIARADSSYNQGAAFKAIRASGDYLVFETDLYISNLATLKFDVGFAYTSSADTAAQMLDYGKYSVVYRNGGFDVFGVTVAPETWVNVCVELDKNSGTVKYYVNGVNTLTVNAGDAPEISHVYINIPAANTKNSYVRLNNTLCDQLEANLTASAEYYTINDGTKPAAITTYYRNKEASLTVTDKAPSNLLGAYETALKLSTTSQNYSANTYFKPNDNAEATKLVFETKLYIDNPDGLTHFFKFINDNIGNPTYYWELRVQLNAAGDLIISDYTSGGGANQVVTITNQLNRWISFKFEAYEDADGNFLVDVYVNGALALTSHNTKWTNVTVDEIKNVFYYPINSYTGDVYIDDVKCVKE